MECKANRKQTENGNRLTEYFNYVDKTVNSGAGLSAFISQHLTHLYTAFVRECEWYIHVIVIGKHMQSHVLHTVKVVTIRWLRSIFCILPNFSVGKVRSLTCIPLAAYTRWLVAVKNGWER